ncbi:MAG: tripartite tricarboxylate transporter substrate binding protein [Polaromonas sp.]|uniref:tripartite tricarboxylate transporter substrate binding protein n=1 Tax=Polaromonas sp. TaxID=1869339 RepID=UPI0025FF5DF3|nr:tripartite tricarboxylate transporter substrate binding protein [Polaromonas sp.]MBI2727727.1 tripartite tricarboxylate transporter substrate binding protein [Polaromonas sp.]
MKRNTRQLLMGAFAAAALMASALPASAQEFPTRPLRMLVGFPPGGSTDVIARDISAELSKVLGQPVVVENKVGVNGILASDALAKSPPDGYTLQLVIPSNVTNAFIYSKLPYDPRKDMTPVAVVASAPMVMVVSPGLGVNTLKEFIARARAAPGAINSGAAGTGSTPSLALDLLGQTAGFKTTSVNYPGSSPQMLGLLRNDVQVAFATTVQALPYVKDNRLKALAVSSATRHPLLPDVPSVQEAGVPGYESVAWFGVFAAPGTPAPIVAKLNAELTRISSLPAMQGRLRAQGADPASSSARQFQDFVAGEFVKWEQFFKLNPMKLD